MDYLLFSKLVRLAVGSLIVFMAYTAYKRTGYPPMLLVALGFGLIGIISILIEEAFKEYEFARLLSEITEILGLITLIIAIKKG